MYKKKYEENIFTKIIKKEIDSKILFESEYTIVVEDKFKKNKTHWLVLPKKEYVDFTHFLNAASSEEILDFFSVMKKFLNKLEYCNVMFNIGLKASQSVFHLHAHILSSLEENKDFNLD